MKVNYFFYNWFLGREFLFREGRLLRQNGNLDFQPVSNVPQTKEAILQMMRTSMDEIKKETDPDKQIQLITTKIDLLSNLKSPAEVKMNVAGLVVLLKTKREQVLKKKGVVNQPVTTEEASDSSRPEDESRRRDVNPDEETNISGQSDATGTSEARVLKNPKNIDLEKLDDSLSGNRLYETMVLLGKNGSKQGRQNFLKKYPEILKKMNMIIEAQGDPTNKKIVDIAIDYTGTEVQNIAMIEAIKTYKEFLIEGKKVKEEVVKISEPEKMKVKDYEKRGDNIYKINKDGIDINSIVDGEISYLKMTDPAGNIFFFKKFNGNRFYSFTPNIASFSIPLLTKAGMIIECLENNTQSISINRIFEYEALTGEKLSLDKVQKDEPLVIGEIHGRRAVLRMSAMKALFQAKDDFNMNNIIIDVNSSFRDVADQKRMKAARPIVAALPGLSTHQTGGAVDVSISLDPKLPKEERGKIEKAQYPKLVEIMAKNKFYSIYESEPWHFEFIPDKEDKSKKAVSAFDTYKIVESFTDVSQDPKYKLLKDALGSMPNAEAEILANYIYKSSEKIEGFEINRETAALLVSTFHRESGMRTQPELSNKQKEKLNKLLSNPNAFIDDVFNDKALEKSKSVFGNWLGEKLVAPIVKPIISATNQYKRPKQAIVETIEKWKKTLPNGVPQTEYDVSRLFAEISKAIYQDEYDFNAWFFDNRIKKYVIDQMEKEKMGSLGIGQLLTTKARELFSNYNKEHPDHPIGPRDLNDQVLEKYLYTLEGGMTSSVLYFSKIIKNCDTQCKDTNSFIDRMEYVTAEYNAGEFSCRNAYLQELINMLNFKKNNYRNPLSLDGDFGKETEEAVLAINSLYKLTLSKEQIKTDLGIEHKGKLSTIDKTKTFQKIVSLAKMEFPATAKTEQFKIPDIKSGLGVPVKSYVGGTMMRVMSKLDYALFKQKEKEYRQSKILTEEKETQNSPLIKGLDDLSKKFLRDKEKDKIPLNEMQKLLGTKHLITIDDGPTENTEQMLNVLDQVKAKAIFYLRGDRMNTSYQKNLVREIVKRGHIIGYHTMTHKQSDRGYNENNIVQDFSAFKKSLDSILGYNYPLTLVRIPGGSEDNYQDYLKARKKEGSPLALTCSLDRFTEKPGYGPGANWDIDDNKFRNMRNYKFKEGGQRRKNEYYQQEYLQKEYDKVFLFHEGKSDLETLTAMATAQGKTVPSLKRTADKSTNGPFMPEQKLYAEDYFQIWHLFKEEYKKTRDDPELIAKRQEKREQKGFKKAGEKMYSIAEKKIEGTPKGFYEKTNAKCIAVLDTKDYKFGNYNNWSYAKWDELRDTYVYADNFNKPIRFLNNGSYLIKIAEESEAEKQIKSDVFYKNNYGYTIAGEIISKNGADFKKMSNWQDIAINGLPAKWDDGIKNYRYLYDKREVKFDGGNKYVLENRSYIRQVQSKIQGDNAQIREYVKKQDLVKDQMFVLVNKEADKQYALLGKYQDNGHFEIITVDHVSTGASDDLTPLGRYKVQRIVKAEAMGRVYGGERTEYPYKVFDISRREGMALHPTNNVAALGTRASHGCTRIPFTFSRQIEKYVNIGTPVMIVSI